MSTHEPPTQGPSGLAPATPTILTDYAAQVKAMGDDEISAALDVMREAASYTGRWGMDRLQILNTEIKRRRKHRRGEGRAA